MNGSVFILNEKALYCSNDADMTLQNHVNRDITGKITSSRRQEVILTLNFMAINGVLNKDDKVHCQFKFDDNNNVESFSAIVESITDEVITLHLKARSQHNKEILNTIKNKIKEEINHGRK